VEGAHYDPPPQSYLPLDGINNDLLIPSVATAALAKARLKLHKDSQAKPEALWGRTLDSWLQLRAISTANRHIGTHADGRRDSAVKWFGRSAFA